MKAWNRKTGPVQCFGKCEIEEALAKAILGEPHFVEDDPSRTHSGTEMFWVFETDGGDALAFLFHQIISELYVGTNGNQAEAEAAVKANFRVDYSPSSGELWN